MKRILIISTFLCLTHGARSQTSPAETLAERLATRMKDSLGLSDVQKAAVYQINMQLHNQKVAIRQQSPVADSLRIFIQRVENSRDSIYRTVLPDEKYILYLQKKRNLINNN